MGRERNRESQCNNINTENPFEKIEYIRAISESEHVQVHMDFFTKWVEAYAIPN